MMGISLLRYTIFMQSAGNRPRGIGELSARNEVNSCRRSREVLLNVCMYLESR